jgi:hypothetical protein
MPPAAPAAMAWGERFEAQNCAGNEGRVIFASILDVCDRRTREACAASTQEIRLESVLTNLSYS